MKRTALIKRAALASALALSLVGVFAPRGAGARVGDPAARGSYRFSLGDGASMLRFGLEVLPTGRPAFRAETQCAVPDTTRTKFAPGATVNVKFGVYGSPQVAVDYAP